jgi:hypothetical protein
MSFQPSRTRTSAKNYKRALVIAALMTAIATALLVIPPWWHLIMEPGLTPGPGPVPTLPVSSPTPVPSVSDQVRPVTRQPQQQVCARWQSNESQKTYDFICQGPGAFLVRQIDSDGRENTGTGTASADGQVQVEILIARNNRTAHLRLRLSGDGQRLEGSWYGNATVESGEVSFHRIQ